MESCAYSFLLKIKFFVYITEYTFLWSLYGAKIHKHTRPSPLHTAVPLPPLENIADEQKNQSLFKRALTYQGNQVIAWDLHLKVRN